MLGLLVLLSARGILSWGPGPLGLGDQSFWTVPPSETIVRFLLNLSFSVSRAAYVRCVVFAELAWLVDWPFSRRFVLESDTLIFVLP